MANELDTVSIYQLRPADTGSVSALSGSHTSILGDNAQRHQPVMPDAGTNLNKAEALSARAIDETDIARTVELLNQAMERFQHTVEFQHDEATDRTVILVKDHDSGEVLRQIPHEDTLRLMERLQELDMLQPSAVREATSSFLVDEHF